MAEGETTCRSSVLAFYGPTLGSPLDPSTLPEKANMAKYGSGEWHRVLVDATRSWEFEPRPEWGGRHYPAINKISPAWTPGSPVAGRSTGSASPIATARVGSGLRLNKPVSRCQ